MAVKCHHKATLAVVHRALKIILDTRQIIAGEIKHSLPLKKIKIFERHTSSTRRVPAFYRSVMKLMDGRKNETEEYWR